MEGPEEESWGRRLKFGGGYFNNSDFCYRVLAWVVCPLRSKATHPLTADHEFFRSLPHWQVLAEHKGYNCSERQTACTHYHRSNRSSAFEQEFQLVMQAGFTPFRVEYPGEDEPWK